MERRRPKYKNTSNLLECFSKLMPGEGSRNDLNFFLGVHAHTIESIIFVRCCDSVGKQSIDHAALLVIRSRHDVSHDAHTIRVLMLYITMQHTAQMEGMFCSTTTLKLLAAALCMHSEQGQ